MAEVESVKNGDSVKEVGDAPAVAVDSAVEDKIIKQVEYYFGDINLMKDKFLKEKIQEDDGWVTMETMLKFNRLKSLSDVPKVICDALRKSESGLVEVTEDNNKMRRNPEKPLPGDSRERRDEINAKTIYAKEFPEDITLDALMTFFEAYGSVENMFMRRDFKKKTFKGSVFVTFTKQEDADKFIAEEGIKYNEQELIKKSKSDYFTEKSGRKYNKGNKDTEKKEGEGEEDAEGKEADEEEKVRQQMTKNAVLHINGMDPETSREDVKNFFQDISPVGWVDFNSGVTEGYLRLREPNSAEPAITKAKELGEGKITIKGKEVEVRAVEGDEEFDYWKKMFKQINERNTFKKRRGGFGGGGRGGGRRGGRGRGGFQGKRRNDRNRDGAPSAKVAKT